MFPLRTAIMQLKRGPLWTHLCWRIDAGIISLYNLKLATTGKGTWKKLLENTYFHLIEFHFQLHYGLRLSKINVRSRSLQTHCRRKEIIIGLKFRLKNFKCLSRNPQGYRAANAQKREIL